MNENPSHPMMNTRYDFEREDAEGRGQCDLQGSLECAAAQECHRVCWHGNSELICIRENEVN